MADDMNAHETYGELPDLMAKPPAVWLTAEEVWIYGDNRRRLGRTRYVLALAPEGTKVVPADAVTIPYKLARYLLDCDLRPVTSVPEAAWVVDAIREQLDGPATL